MEIFVQFKIEYYGSKDETKTYKKIYNSKRPDFVIIRKDNSFPVAIIEVNGSGHSLRGEQETKYRDETIKILCNKAGINYHEFIINGDQLLNNWILQELNYLTNNIS